MKIYSQSIVSPTLARGRKLARKLKREAAAEDKARQEARRNGTWLKSTSDTSPPLLVHTEAGKVQLPEHTVWLIINHRLAIPVGDFHAQADVIVEGAG